MKIKYLSLILICILTVGFFSCSLDSSGPVEEIETTMTKACTMDFVWDLTTYTWPIHLQGQGKSFEFFA